MSNPTVWVLKEQMRGGDAKQVFDYTPAMKYGELRFATDFDLPLHPNSSVRAAWFTDVNVMISEFDAERDWLILTGQPLAIFVAGQMFAALGVTPRILVWRREQNAYVPFDH